MILEEKYPSGTLPTSTGNMADMTWNPRNLGSQPVPTNNFVTLIGSNIKFLKTGTYLISASAPAFETGQHKLCLREVGTAVVILAGSSEDADAIFDVNGSKKGAVTKSTILGKLTVTSGNLSTQYSLDHWIYNNAGVSGNSNPLGFRCNIPNVPEVYAQMMIQKIQ